MIASGTSGIVNDASHHTGLPSTQGTMTMAIATSGHRICLRPSGPDLRNRAASETKARSITALVIMYRNNVKGCGSDRSGEDMNSIANASTARTATEPQTSGRQRGEGSLPSG
ncbi:hypothetical protein ACFPKZ_15950 [Streptosporangium amethystogenes subsp. fukuiense]|uniref:hypothetical protein n=1 Tax=Streptosporangium amethystogenes TaxID=2002 RepID=UPI00360A10B6